MTNSTLSKPRSERPNSAVPLAIVAGFPPAAFSCGDRIRIEYAGNSGDILNRMEGGEVAALVLGPQLNPGEAQAILRAVAARFPAHTTSLVVFTKSPDIGFFRELIDNDRLFYLSRWTAGTLDPAVLIGAAVRAHIDAPTGLTPVTVSAGVTALVLDYSLQLSAQDDIERMCSLISQAIRSVTGAGEAQCLLYDPLTDSFRRSGNAGYEASNQSASAGLASYSFRTGESLQLAGMRDDPRFDPELDDPAGQGRGPFLCEPLVLIPGCPIGALVAVRTDSAKPFTADESAGLKLFAGNAAPMLSAALTQQCLRREFASQTRSVRADIFRQEAIDFHDLGAEQDGCDLQALPRWISAAWWIVLCSILAGLVCLALIRVEETAQAPVTISARDKVTVIAPERSVASMILVAEGDRVRSGDDLIRLQGPAGLPVRSTRDGVVGDIRVRTGDLVEAGAPLISVIDDRAGFQIVAAIPFHVGHVIAPRSVIHVAWNAYPGIRIPVTMDRVGTQPASEIEVKRRLGLPDRTSPPPSVIATSELASSQFIFDSRALEYRDGMTGIATVTVGSEPAIFRLLPSLGKAYANWRGEASR